MADNNKKMPTTSKLNLKSKRPATVKVAGAKFNETVNPGSAGHSIPSNPSSNATLQVDYGKKRPPTTRSAGIKTNETVSAGSAGDSNNSMPILNSTVLQIEHGKFLRAMLEECLVSEKIQREETQMDIQLALLADRFQKTIDQLDKTNRRLKEVSFVAEQKRLVDLKRQDCAKYYELTEESNAKTVMDNLAATEQACLDKLDVINVDSGYDKDTGHKQLLDAVTDALDGLEQIKRKSKLNMDTFKQYMEMEENIKHVDSERREFEGLKDSLQNELPRFGETALKQISESVVGILDGNELSRQLDLWLSKADLTHGPARAIIAPHAGYSYCGACAAFAYRQISPVVVKRIFILGPSHHVRLGGCALSSLDKYQTPLYDLTIDKQIYTELEATRQFTWMDVQTDEDEHSIEMHLPYIAKVMEEYKTGFTIIPILVGSLTPEKEAKYGAILAPYLADPQNLVVISSDFCHWGSRFRYTWRDASRGHIHQSIEWLDRQGMDIIERMDPRAFTEYLNKYGNTICGRHPIGVLLQAIAKLSNHPNAPKMSMEFLKYAQSSQCMNQQDSSVSYASASLVFE